MRRALALTGRNSDEWRIVALVVAWTAALYVAVALSFVGSGRKVAPGRFFAGWDSIHYLSIARSGYEWQDDGRMHTPAFFPLYPLAIRAVSAVDVEPRTAGELISLLSLLAAQLLLARLSRREGFAPVSSAAVMLMFPTAFFFLCVYSESLFLFLAVACLLASRSGKAGAAFFLGALAALTRVNGVLLFVPLVWTWWEENRRAGRLLAAMGPPAGLGLVCVFDAVKFGRPFAWLTVQKTGWHHAITWPWRTIVRGLLWSPRAYFSVAAALIFCGLTLFLWKRQRLYALWLAANLALFLTSGSMLSTGRLVAPLFPAFWPIARAADRSPLFRVVYLAAGAVGLTFDAIRFAHGGWVA